MSRRTQTSGPEPHVYCFVPSEDIDIVALAAYLRSFIDGTASVKPSRHPRDKERLGFTVGASSTLGREALEDLIEDTKAWDKEQNTREFEDRPYDYQDSDTWTRRRRLGPTPPRTTRVVEGRRVPATIPGRHDPKNPGTASEISYSTASTQQGSVFSRGSADPKGSTLSNISESTLAPSDSASEVYQSAYRRGGGGREGREPPPKPDPEQPKPVSYSAAFSNLNISDNNKANQGRQQTNRHAADPKEDTGRRPSDKKDSSQQNIYFKNK